MDHQRAQTSNSNQHAMADDVSALGAVRRATAHRHRLLEAMPAQERLLHDDYRLSEYRSLLERMYGFYEPLGRALCAAADTADWGARVAGRTELLAGDLRALGLTPADMRGLSRCADLPHIDSPDRALGCAYVFEGATLGGRVIFKHLARVFPDRAQVPLRFFAGDGDRTAAHWRAFCATLNAAARDVDEVCAAACAAFETMRAWLDDPGSAER